MAKKSSWLFLAFTSVLFATSQILADVPNWSQFRGPNSSGIAEPDADPPIDFGPQQHLLWKTALPPGHSSPCIWGNHIFLTGYEEKTQTFKVFCLIRESGKIEWQHTIEVEAVEKVRATNNPANATPATDGERVYVYINSFGLLCYDFEGQELWQRPLPLLKTAFGTGTSPVVVDKFVLLNRDEKSKSFLMGIDRLTGATLWESVVDPDVQRETYRASYATPVRWGNEWVIHRYGEIAAYSDAGVLQWSLPAATGGASTPVVGEETLFVGTWNNFGEDQLRVSLPDFDTFVAKNDKDGDGGISREEIPTEQKIARRPEATPETKGRDIGFGSWLFRSTFRMNAAMNNTTCKPTVFTELLKKSNCQTGPGMSAAHREL